MNLHLCGKLPSDRCGFDPEIVAEPAFHFADVNGKTVLVQVHICNVQDFTVTQAMIPADLDVLQRKVGQGGDPAVTGQAAYADNSQYQQAGSGNAKLRTRAANIPPIGCEVFLRFLVLLRLAVFLPDLLRFSLLLFSPATLMTVL